MYFFAHSYFLWLLLLIPLLAWLRGRRGKAAAITFPSISLARKVGARPKSRAGVVLFSMMLLALGLLILGMARPQLGKGHAEVEASGIDIMLAIDVSSSMKAMDFRVDEKRVDRLVAVKRTVKEFIGGRPNDRIGLIVFAGSSYMVSPLTYDQDYLKTRLDSIEVGQVEDGTAIGSAVTSLTSHLTKSDAKSRIGILLTDGNNNSGKVSPMTAAEAAETLGIKVYTIGAGTRGKAPYPVRDVFGREGFQMMEVDIDEESLTEVARMTGGRYYRATDTRSLEKIYEEIDTLEKVQRTMHKYQEVDELFMYFMIPGLVVLLVSVVLGHTIYRELP